MRINFARLNTNGDISGGIITEPILGKDMAAFKERAAAELGDGFGLKSITQETIFINPDDAIIGSLRHIYGTYGNFTGQVTTIEHKIGKKTKTIATILKK